MARARDPHVAKLMHVHIYSRDVLHNVSVVAVDSSHLCVLPRPSRSLDGEKCRDVEACKQQLMYIARLLKAAAESRHRCNTMNISRCGEYNGALA